MIKQGILLVSSGSTWPGAAEKGVDVIYRELGEKYPDEPVYRACCDEGVLTAMRERGGEVRSVSEALEQIASDGITSLHIFPALLVPGKKYDAVRRSAEAFRGRIANITVAEPLFCTQVGETEIVHVLRHILRPVSDKAYLLVAYENNDRLSPIYSDIIEHFQRHDLTNVHLIYLEGSPDVREIISELRKEEVIIEPLMVTAGKHVHEKIMGGSGSVVSELRDRGYRTTVIDRGLAEYAEFRQLFYLSWGVGFR